MDKWKDAATQAVAEAKQNVSKGKQLLNAEREDREPQAPVDVTAAESTGGPTPLYEVVSHIEGKNATVRLWPDRIEWERARGVSAGKITAGVFSGGASLLLTGVKGGRDSFEMLPLKHVTNVSNRKDGMLYHLVEVQTAAGGAINTIGFRVGRDEAAAFRSAILDAMRAADAPPAPAPAPAPATIVVQTAPVALTSETPDLVAQIQQLGALRDAGILSEEEFATKKADLLSRI